MKKLSASSWLIAASVLVWSCACQPRDQQNNSSPRKEEKEEKKEDYCSSVTPAVSPVVEESVSATPEREEVPALEEVAEESGSLEEPVAESSATESEIQESVPSAQLEESTFDSTTAQQ